MLQGKKILLGITGSIAAYKSILIVRLLIKAGAEVKVVMTPSARDFVSTLTLATLSKNKVLVQLADENTWANHVMLGRWADVMLIAPASCNTLAKMTSGLCDNLLMATYLSATCPVVVVPAMDEDMWHHPSTRSNIQLLEQFGHKIISVGKGELASGLFGEGRMAEPEDIVIYLEEHFFRTNQLAGVNALVSAGPTYEALDPVRFVGNHSSGKMGVAIAEALFLAGANVHMVCGPVQVLPKYKAIEVSKVVSAAQMLDKCLSQWPLMNIGVMAAAVADYTPKEISSEKIKKKESNFQIELVKTADILKHLGEDKKEGQLLVGFALETQNEKENALKKLHEKNADLIVLNSLKDSEAGFGKDTNKVTIFDKKGIEFAYDAKSKQLVANDIVQLIINKIHDKA